MLYKLPQLTFLDSRPVSSEERKEAKRVGQFMRVVKPPSDVVCVHVLTFVGSQQCICMSQLHVTFFPVENRLTFCVFTGHLIKVNKDNVPLW